MTSQFARYPSLAKKTVIVTGGATGIGASVVEHFVEQNAQVHFLDIDDRGAGQCVAESMEKFGRKPIFHHCDVTDSKLLSSTIDEIIDQEDGLDVLVNNAANDVRDNLAGVTPETWNESLAINLNHHFFASRAAHRGLELKGGGSIICLGSIAWLNNSTGMIGYTTAKSAIHGLVRSLAVEFGGDNIRVNCVLPGWTMTEKQLLHRIDEKGGEEIRLNQALPNRIMPEDIARMVLFLSSDDSKMCTKQFFVVDGGWI